MEIDEQIQADFFDLRALFHVLKKRWLILGLLAAIAFVPAVVYLKITPKKYETASKFAFRTNGGGMSDDVSKMATLMGMKVGGSDKSDEARLEDFMFSKNIMRKIIDTTYQTDPDGLFHGQQIHLWDLWKIKPDTTTEKKKRDFYDGMTSRLRSKRDRYISHTLLPTTSHQIITRFEDPIVTNSVNEILLAELSDLLGTKLRFKARENSKFIKEQLVEAQDELRQAENRRSAWMEQNKNYSAPGPALEKERLTREVYVYSELFLQAKKQYEIAKIEEMREVPLIDIIDGSEISNGVASPNRTQVLIIGIFFAGFFSLCSVLGFEFLVYLWKGSSKPSRK